jgi:hypothetical protein
VTACLVALAGLLFVALGLVLLSRLPPPPWP